MHRGGALSSSRRRIRFPPFEGPSSSFEPVVIFVFVLHRTSFYSPRVTRFRRAVIKPTLFDVTKNGKLRICDGRVPHLVGVHRVLECRSEVASAGFREPCEHGS